MKYGSNYNNAGNYEIELNAWLDHVNDMIELAEKYDREYRRDYGGNWYDHQDSFDLMVA